MVRLLVLRLSIVGPSIPEVKVRWDNGSTTWLVTDEIDAKKGIGYFTEEGYYG